METFMEPDPAERRALNRLFYRNRRAPMLSEYVRVASSGRQHFPLPVGAPLTDFAAIASQYRVVDRARLESEMGESHRATLNHLVA